jgi:hypothetical protein
MQGSPSIAAALRPSGKEIPLIRQSISGADLPNEQEVQALVPQELLKMAKEWKRNPEKVLTRLTECPEMA